MKYLAFIHTDTASETGTASENEAPFGISFPDFPGCISDGDSLDDAVARGSAALEMHIRGMKEDGLPIPDPRSIDAIQADNSLDGWRDGAVLIWVPVIIETGESRRVNVSFDAALLEAVDHEAGRRGMTRSGLLADAVRKEIVTN